MSKREQIKMQTATIDPSPENKEIHHLDYFGIDSARICIWMASNQHLDNAIEKLTNLVTELQKIKRYRLNRSYAMSLSIGAIQSTSRALRPPPKEQRTPKRGRGYPIASRDKFSWEDE